MVPTGLMLACWWTAFSLVRLEPWLIWSPIPWLLTISGIYYGFGPLAYSFGNAVSVTAMDIFYPVRPNQILRAEVLVLTGIMVVMATTYWVIPRSSRSTPPATPR